jgi:hypothetical protein
MEEERLRFVFMEDLHMDHDYFNQHHMTCHEPNTQTFFTQMMIFIGVVQFSLLISMIIVGKFVYKPMIENALSEVIDVDVVEIPYEYKYNLKNVLHENDDVNPNSSVCETTPEGVVFMKYDKDEEGFVYWSNKSIRFNYLDVVARKYCKMFLCKDLYIPNGIYDNEDEDDYDADIESDATNNVENIDDDEESQENDEDEIEEQVESSESEEEEESVFLTKKSSSSTRNETSDNKYNNNNAKPVVKRNKFIHKGKIAEFELMQKYEPEEVVTKKKMTFDTFKDLFYGSNSTSNKNTKI